MPSSEFRRQNSKENKSSSNTANFDLGLDGSKELGKLLVIMYKFKKKRSHFFGVWWNH